MGSVDSKELKLGLVLSGGGGKGAYQIGCWKALRELGLANFRAISGTSVGALNAALIAMGNLEKAQEIWMGLNEEKVFRTTRWRKALVVARIAALVFMWTSLQVLINALIFVLGIVGGPFFVLWLSWALPQHSSNDDLLQFALNTPLERFVVEILGLPIWSWLFALALAGGMTWLTMSKLRGGLINTIKNLFLANLENLATSKGHKFQIASNRPLHKLVSGLISLERLRESNAKVFVTVSVLDNYFDGFVPHYLPTQALDYGDPRAYQAPIPDSDRIPGVYSSWVPEAVELTTLSTKEEAVRALVESANLPLLFKQGTWLGKFSMDGGVTENTPVYPVAEAGCNVVFVIYLDASAEGTPAEVRERMRSWHHSKIKRDMSLENAIMIYKEFCETGKEQIPPDPPFSLKDDQLVLVVPSSPLGNTTDFSGGERARKLIEQGYKDMLEALCRHTRFKAIIPLNYAQRNDRQSEFKEYP
jgi:predicted acylesterase/phospholipase RssA